MENNQSAASAPLDSQKNLNEFTIDDLIKQTHAKIAKWHNDEPTTVSLKHLSLELIEDIAGAAFEHLGLKYTPALNLDSETKNKLEEEKKKSQTLIVDISKLSDAEFLKEYNRRIKNK